MKCPNPECQSENRQDSRFCTACGVDLKTRPPDIGVRGNFSNVSNPHDFSSEDSSTTTSSSLRKIAGLNPREYEHHLDRKALDAVQKLRGLDAITRFINDYGERFLRLEVVASNLRVTETSLPEIYKILKDICKILNLEDIPELYIRGNDFFRILPFPTNNLQGITVGVKEPVVVISSECIENYSKPELLFILGCEIGRIKSQHLLYHNMSLLLPLFSRIIGFGIAVDWLMFFLVQWLRMADYTADRAGLLACQNKDVAMMAMAKMAGLPKKYFDSFQVDSFVSQAKKFEGFGNSVNSIVDEEMLNQSGISDKNIFSKLLDLGKIGLNKLSNKANDQFDRLVKMYSSSITDQAFTVARASELEKWVDSGEYDAVLERKTRIRYCSNPDCNRELLPSAKFCGYCRTEVLPESTPPT